MAVDASSIVRRVIQIKNGIITHVNVNENYRKYKTDYILDPSMCICEDSKYLKSIAERTLIECDKVIIVIDNVSTKKTNTLVAKETNTIANTIATNVACTSSINCQSKKVKDHYI